MKTNLNYHSELSYELIQPIIKSNYLNKIKELINYLKINQLLEFSYVRTINMSDVIYFRITNTNILPTYLFWHITQDFHNNRVKKLANRDYIGLRNLSNHIIYVSGQPITMANIGQFVKQGGRANLSIGRYPHNFGDVKLLNARHYQVKKQR